MCVWKVHGNEFFYCEDRGFFFIKPLLGDCGLEVWQTESQVTSWKSCPCNPLSLSVDVISGLLLTTAYGKGRNFLSAIALQKVVTSVWLGSCPSLALLKSVAALGSSHGKVPSGASGGQSVRNRLSLPAGWDSPA